MTVIAAIVILSVYAIIATIVAWGARVSWLYWRNLATELRQAASDNTEPSWHHDIDDYTPNEEAWKMFVKQFDHAPTFEDKINLVTYWIESTGQEFTFFEENFIITSFDSEAERDCMRTTILNTRKKIDGEIVSDVEEND